MLSSLISHCDHLQAFTHEVSSVCHLLLLCYWQNPYSAILGLDNTFAENLLCIEVTKTLFLPPKPQTALSLLPPEGLLSTASQHHTTGETRILLILPTPSPSQHWLLFSRHPGCEQEQGFCLCLAQSPWGGARAGEGHGLGRGMGQQQPFRCALHRELRRPIVPDAHWATPRLFFQHIQEPGPWSKSAVQ